MMVTDGLRGDNYGYNDGEWWSTKGPMDNQWMVNNAE